MENLVLESLKLSEIMNKPKYGKEKREIIKRLVKQPRVDDKYFWPREMKILNKLWEKYPDPKFWETFVLTFQLNSLAWLLTEDGQAQLYKQKAHFDLDANKKQTIILQDKPMQAAPVVVKPKTLAEFLKLKQHQ